MKYFTKEINGNEVNFRLTSGDSLEIEKKYGMSLQEYIQKINNTSCVTLLRYMRKSSDNGFSADRANQLFDELVDDGYSLQTIYMDIIFPTCVVSGVLTQEDLDRIKAAVENKKEEVDKDTTPKSE